MAAAIRNNGGGECRLKADSERRLKMNLHLSALSMCKSGVFYVNSQTALLTNYSAGTREVHHE
jgi:hypothetical protein